ncbi:MAG: hypothetical protein ACREIP_16680, partial [Alphaproteobacteria bacterium]
MVNQTGRVFAPFACIAALVGLAALSACGGGPRHTGSMTEQLARCRAESGNIYSATSFDDYVSR